MQKEFEKQINNLLNKNYPELAGMSREEFLNRIEPLRSEVEKLEEKEIDIENGKIPFVIVIKSGKISIEKMMSLVEFHGKNGVVSMTPSEPESFKPIEEVQIPGKFAYLLIDIDRGKETLNIAPQDAFEMIKKEGRSPLTIDEGIAIITQYPEFLIKNNCFSLLASRASDKRVPAIWISGEKAPKLGWCWNGNPHTWLGSASCGGRI